MRFFIEIQNELGTFKGDVLEGTREVYDGLLQQLSKFHLENGYEMFLADGSYFIIGPELLKKSALRIIIIAN